MTGKVIIVKTILQYFLPAWNGNKPFELRQDDRDYKVGDLLVQLEYSPESTRYSGRLTVGEITYKLNGGLYGLEEGYCILGIPEYMAIDIYDPTRSFSYGREMKVRVTDTQIDLIKEVFRTTEQDSERLTPVIEAICFGETIVPKESYKVVPLKSDKIIPFPVTGDYPA